VLICYANESVLIWESCGCFQVKTQDGFILNMQRIPEGRAGGGDTKRQPVLIQHGVLVVSAFIPVPNLFQYESVSLQHRLVFFLVMSKGKEEDDEDEQHKKTKKMKRRKNIL